LAGALVHKPALLVLDEPTNHLDAEGIRTLISGLKALPGSPALVIVTHHWDMTGMADACYRLEGGRLVFIS
jgi:ABC-2 type transport system ATP-binding protein